MMPAPARLSALDGSFLRLESPSAHMHVGWMALMEPPPQGSRITLRALRARVATRLGDVPWCRWRLHVSPLGLREPSWVQADAFELREHVLSLARPSEPVTYARLARLREGVLSTPLDRSRPPWQIFLVPRLEDDRIAIIGKIHHALVDGIAALQIVGLVIDSPARGSGHAGTPVPADHGTLDGVRGRLRVAAGLAGQPAVRAVGLARDATRLAKAARDDVLPAAPASPLNVSIGARRTLVGFRATRAELAAARSEGGTLNDIGLTIVAGALRRLTLGRGEAPAAPWKAMVPVNMRRPDETGAGNRIALVYIRLPVHIASPRERLEWVRTQTDQLKRSRRAENMQTLYSAGGLVPAPLRAAVTKALAAERVFNLTISQSPGPRGVVHVLGCEVQEVYSVVPISDGHALAIGMVRYRQELFIGCYADPDALPEVKDLPTLLRAELRALSDAGSRPAGTTPPAPRRG